MAGHWSELRHRSNLLGESYGIEGKTPIPVLAEIKPPILTPGKLCEPYTTGNDTQCHVIYIGIGICKMYFFDDDRRSARS